VVVGPNWAQSTEEESFDSSLAASSVGLEWERRQTVDVVDQHETMDFEQPTVVQLLIHVVRLLNLS
jgi:hypothetical protein